MTTLMRIAIGAPLLALSACGGCDTLTGSCSGLGEFGLVRATVLDQDATPVPDVSVCSTMGTGATAQVCGSTQNDGTVDLPPVRAGSRRVSVDPPTGYVQGSTPLEKTVLVVRDQTTEVEFRLLQQ